MSDQVTITAPNVETIYSCSPAEYVKRANARDMRMRDSRNLTYFAAFLMARIGESHTIPADELDGLVGEYLDGIEASPR